jgi:hypothetical protein
MEPMAAGPPTRLQKYARIEANFVEIGPTYYRGKIADFCGGKLNGKRIQNIY